jgi:hypothetical protein
MNDPTPLVLVICVELYVIACVVIIQHPQWFG